MQDCLNHYVATALTARGMRRRVPAEERSDDEDRTSLVTDRREKEIRKFIRASRVIAPHALITYEKTRVNHFETFGSFSS